MYARTGRGRASTGLPVTDRQGRTIGRIRGREYHKLVTRADQMLRSPPGFGFDAWAMEQLVLSRVDRLVVTCRFDGRVYTTTVDAFRRSRIEIDRGAGAQYVLPLCYWHEGGASAAVAPAAPDRGEDPAPAVPVQGRLF
jgi:hypothetical protein